MFRILERNSINWMLYKGQVDPASPCYCQNTISDCFKILPYLLLILFSSNQFHYKRGIEIIYCAKCVFSKILAEQKV